MYHCQHLLLFYGRSISLNYNLHSKNEDVEFHKTEKSYGNKAMSEYFDTVG